MRENQCFLGSVGCDGGTSVRQGRGSHASMQRAPPTLTKPATTVAGIYNGARQCQPEMCNNKTGLSKFGNTPSVPR